MKTFTKVYLAICLCIFQWAVSNQAQAQCVTSHTGNHLSMTMENCVQSTSKIIEFDLYVSSDGTSTSDLRMNAASYGINFNTGILPSGATINPVYVGNTDPIFPC